jgi:hypothetical protein
MSVSPRHRSEDIVRQRLDIIAAAKRDLSAIEAVVWTTRQNMERGFDLLRRARALRLQPEIWARYPNAPHGE